MGALLTQKQQLNVKSKYLRQTVPHVAFSLNSPILGRGGDQRAHNARACPGGQPDTPGTGGNADAPVSPG